MSITRVKKRITKTTLNSVSYATHKQLFDHSVNMFGTLKVDMFFTTKVNTFFTK